MAASRILVQFQTFSLYIQHVIIIATSTMVARGRQQSDLRLAFRMQVLLYVRVVHDDTGAMALISFEDIWCGLDDRNQAITACDRLLGDVLAHCSGLGDRTGVWLCATKLGT